MSLKTCPTIRPGSATSPVRVSLASFPLGSVRKFVIMWKSALAFWPFSSSTSRLSHSGCGGLVAGVEGAPRRQRRLVDDVHVAGARGRRDLRGDPVAKVDVDVLLAHDVVEAALTAAGHVAVRAGDPLRGVCGVAVTGVRGVLR